MLLDGEPVRPHPRQGQGYAVGSCTCGGEWAQVQVWCLRYCNGVRLLWARGMDAQVLLPCSRAALVLVLGRASGGLLRRGAEPGGLEGGAFCEG